MKPLVPWSKSTGGQNGENAWRAAEAGADALVAGSAVFGSAVFGSANHAAAIANLRLHPKPR